MLSAGSGKLGGWEGRMINTIFMLVGMLLWGAVPWGVSWEAFLRKATVISYAPSDQITIRLDHYKERPEAYVVLSLSSFSAFALVHCGWFLLPFPLFL